MSDKPSQLPHGQVLRMVTDVVAHYLSKNPVAPADLPGVINSVYVALNGQTATPVVAAEARPEPAVPIKRSVNADYIICLEDGKKLKMLKRHLATAYGLTPEEYRNRWNLPADYPMVAPNYAAQRSALAKEIGLGSRPRVPKKPVKTRGRKPSGA